MFTATRPPALHRRGFTLIEMMVTMAIVAILAALASPSIRDLIVRNQFSNIGNEFSGSILRARNEAISRNSCSTMCMSSNVDEDEPSCSTTGQNWQGGWIVFLNMSCDVALNSPDAAEDMILARRPGNTAYLLQARENVRRFTFNSQGRPESLNTKQFDLIYEDATNPLTVKYGSSMCVDGMGKMRTKKAGEVC
jgi:type IV fimbrial biogenesis protein FimT